MTEPPIDALDEGVLRVIRAIDEAAATAPARVDVVFGAAPAPLHLEPYDI